MNPLRFAKSASRPMKLEICEGRLFGRESRDASAGNSLLSPGATTWYIFSDWIKSFNLCDPRSRNVALLLSEPWTKSSVVEDTRICSP